MVLRVPPGGFAGFAQMTPASRLALSDVTRAPRGPRRKRTARKARSAAKRAVKRATKRAGRKLKFGSPAWRKRYMRKGRK